MNDLSDDANRDAQRWITQAREEIDGASRVIADNPPRMYRCSQANHQHGEQTYRWSVS